MEKQTNYSPPKITVTQVVLETGIAGDLCPVSVDVSLHDWDIGGELGGDPEDGGDIYLMY